MLDLHIYCTMNFTDFESKYINIWSCVPLSQHCFNYDFKFSSAAQFPAYGRFGVLCFQGTLCVRYIYVV